MGGSASEFWKIPEQKEREGKRILPKQLDAEDEIAGYASIGDPATSRVPCAGAARRRCVNCPTCQGTGRIPREQERQLVALIPYGDQRLKPRRTKNVLNITNNNFYWVTVVQLDVEVLHQSLVIGKTTMNTLLKMSPLQSGQIYYTVASTILDSNTYNICTWAKVKVHNVLLHVQGTLTCTYLCHSEQVLFEDYQYVDCRGNATLPPAPP
ncbi:Tmem106a [Columba livia]|nr:Tmem106a [Columba livia]